MSRAQLTSTVEQNTGGAVAPFLAGKNKIINGDFGVWQRGTSFSNPNGYTADRWIVSCNNTATASQQTFTPGTAPVVGYEGQYFFRIARTSTASTDYFYQRIENVRTFAAQTVTISFWAKASSNATLDTVYADLNYGTSGSTGTYFVFTNNVSLTTSWQRFSYTTTVPSVSGKTIGANSYIAPTFQLGSGMGSISIDFWGVQLEAGSVATPFTTATGTLSGELAACQRYYTRVSAAGGNYTKFGTGMANTTTSVQAYIPFTVTMRAVPIVLDYSNLAAYDGGIAAISAAVYDNASTNGGGVNFTTATLTAGKPFIIIANNNTAAYLGFGAEL